MNYRLRTLCVLSLLLCVNYLDANTRGFAPYDKERGFGFDLRSQGNLLLQTDHYFPTVFSLSMNGYYKGESGWFVKFGIPVFFASHVPIPVPLPNLQAGLYHPGKAAIRFGLFYGLPGLGTDIWVAPNKWLTTLEVFGYKGRSDGVMLGMSWLNRIFINDVCYLSAGVNGFGLLGKDCPTGVFFGSLGIGAAF